MIARGWWWWWRWWWWYHPFFIDNNSSSAERPIFSEPNVSRSKLDSYWRLKKASPCSIAMWTFGANGSRMWNSERCFKKGLKGLLVLKLTVRWMLSYERKSVHLNELGEILREVTSASAKRFKKALNWARLGSLASARLFTTSSNQERIHSRFYVTIPYLLDLH